MTASLYISPIVLRLTRKGVSQPVAIIEGVRRWKASPDRAALMSEYVKRGFALEENARARKANGDKEPSLRAGLFEIAARHR